MTTTPKTLDPPPTGSVAEPVLIHGRVRRVDLASRTADFDWLGGKRLLRYPPELGSAVNELKDRFVEVKGIGAYDGSGRLVEVHLDAIRHESDEIDELLAGDDWQRFDPDKVVRADEPFDVDDFLHDIYADRRRGRCNCEKP